MPNAQQGLQVSLSLASLLSVRRFNEAVTQPTERGVTPHMAARVCATGRVRLPPMPREPEAPARYLKRADKTTLRLFNEEVNMGVPNSPATCACGAVGGVVEQSDRFDEDRWFVIQHEGGVRHVNDRIVVGDAFRFKMRSEA